ncbi:MAG: hypothetical protein CSB44_11805 [Gammaproteobacteria bacterium]|nr:MAG: hypothetical protein CSB44_11805 [Gammaproteobacteria bacterium]
MAVRPDDTAQLLQTLQSFTLSGIDFVPVQRRTDFRYDGNRLVEIDGPRQDADDRVRFEWDQHNRLVSVKPSQAPEFHVAGHDALGRANRFGWGERTPVELTYDDRSQVLSARQGENVVQYEYDEDGRLISVTDTFGRRRSIRYDEAGRAEASIDDLGRAIHAELDRDSRLTGLTQIDAAGSIVRQLSLALDSADRISGSVEQRFEEDGSLHSRLARQWPVLRSGSVEPAEDDGAPRSVRDGRQLSHVSADGVRTDVELDVHGLPQRVRDARGNVTLLLRDDFAQLVVEASADGGWVERAYDEAGNRTGSVLADGTEVRFRFDAANRQTERDDGSSRSEWQWDNASGHLVAAINEATAERYGYDRDGRLNVHERWLGGRQYVTRYTYDAFGRVHEKTLPDGRTLIHHYHDDGVNRGRLRAITESRLAGLYQQTLIAELDLDSRDGQSGHVHGNGVRTDERYDRYGQLSQYEVGGELALDYGFDDAGRLVSLEHNGQVQRYRYSGNGLVGADTRLGQYGYRYDVLGNRVSKTEPGLDGIERTTDYHFGADGEGNRLQLVQDIGDGAEESYDYLPSGAPSRIGDLAYEYDSLSRPVRVYRNDVLLAEYQYNAFGERVGKTVYESAEDSTGRSTYYLYDSTVVAAEINDAGEVESQFVYVDGIRPVSLLRSDGVYGIHADDRGAPRLVTDHEGQVVWQADYSPYGEIVIEKEAITLNLRLAGQYHDEETGTHYNYFRDYSPSTGRYLTSDPVGLIAGLNRYAYVGGDPLNAIDPLGLLYQETFTGRLLYLARLSRPAIAAAAAAVTLPAWATVAVGVSVTALAVYYAVDYGSNEEEFANDFGARPTAEDYMTLRTAMADYDVDLAFDENLWDGTWASYFDMHDRLLQLQQEYVDHVEGQTEPCLLPHDDVLYQQALDSLEVAGVSRDAAFDAMASNYISPEGIPFSSEAEYRTALLAYDLAGGSNTGLTFEEWWQQYGSRGESSHEVTAEDMAAIDRKISDQKQFRHIYGRMEWERAKKNGYLKSLAEAQKILDAFHAGEVTILGKMKNEGILIKYNGVTGTNVNRLHGIEGEPTNVFIIKGTKKVSVVPASPAARPYR